MNTNTTLSKGSWIQLNERRAARAGILLLLLLLTLPAVVEAQFTYRTNNGTVTITGYTGPGGAVTIPDTINVGGFNLPVTSIGVDAFYDCTSLTSVTIGTNVTSIGDLAFEGTGLTSVSIPNSVTNIGDYAFEYCGSLTNVTIGTNVTSIGGWAFAMTVLTSVTIPDSVTSIGDYVFCDDNSLPSVMIGNGVTNIGALAFVGCFSLTAITAGTSNPAYSSVGGVLFNKSQTTLIAYPEGKTDSSYTIPNSVTSIGPNAFDGCTSLTSVTIPDSVTNIGGNAFAVCRSLTSVTIPNSVTSIGPNAFDGCSSLTSVTIGTNVTSILSAFGGCSSLTSVTIPDSVTSIEQWEFCNCHALTSITIGKGVNIIRDHAFYACGSLTAVIFKGNAPSLGSDEFDGDNHATVYYLPGSRGWGTTFGGRPAVLWNPPTIQTSPQTQTAEAGSAVGLRVKASGSSPLFCLWYLNSTNLISRSTNWELELTNLQFTESGTYTVVVSNALGTVTSAPVILNVIAAVGRRPVPSIKVMGETASVLNVDYADSLSPAPLWTPLGSVSLTGTTGYCCDPTLPLPPQRFYRAWQTGTPGVMPSLDLHPVPAITLTGTIGHAVRLDYINQFGPTDAWVTLATVPLTNTSQLYFDISAPGQPQRLYRLIPSP